MRDIRTRATSRLAAWGPEGADTLLYVASALFAGATALFSGIALYRVWGEMAAGPYLLAAVVSGFVVLRRRHRRETSADQTATDQTPSDQTPSDDGAGGRRIGLRLWLIGLVFVGATLAPLALEVGLRGHGSVASHEQPEDRTITQAGTLLVNGKDPYHAMVEHGRVVSAVPGEPTYESFFPYLPLMTAFGLPSSGRHPFVLSDPRILFSLFTLVVVALALLLCRGPRDGKLRTLQFLAVLPTAALPLATGGDDIPVVALLLLAMVLAQRRRPGWSGLVLGVVSAMKFTAWPLAALALFAARDRDGRRAPGRMALGMAAVAVPAVLPFIFQNPHTFVANVILFPLGLAGVASPAASPLPGHLLVSAFPDLHRVLPITVAALGGAVLVHRLFRHPPATVAEASTLAAWVMLAALLFAPATRVGYLLYPIDFLIWANMLKRSEPAENELTAKTSPQVLVA